MRLLTEQNFTTDHWQSVFPEMKIEIVDSSADSVNSINFAGDKLVWILAGIPQWQKYITNAVKQAGCKVIVMSRHANSTEFQEAFAAGASGYIDALANEQLLKLAQQTVESGAVWLPSPIVNDLIKNLAPKIQTSHQPDLSELTHKEIEVANKVSEGDSNSEIAQNLQITERTVKSHLTQIYRKLGLRDRMQLMLYIKGADRKV